jgi:hypothetical protein
MTQLDEAVARYHRLLENETVRTSGWLEKVREQMAEQRLFVNGRPVSPVLRPHFISRRQYTNLMKTAELINTAIERVRTLALENPALMARMEMLPAEKMLAQVDPGYAAPVAALLDTQVNNGSLHMTGSQADLPAGVLYNEALSNIFYDTLPVKDIRKRFKLTKTGGSKPLVQALLKAWKQFGGSKEPVIGVLEFKQAFETAESHESLLLVELFEKNGYRAEIIAPDQLEYRDGQLRAGETVLDVVYRNLRAHEFLMRFDLRHPLVRAYRERKVCVVNSFRTELTRKRALLALLTDPEVNKGFPAAERHAIADTIPWTRVVTLGKTTAPDGTTVDLPEYLLKHREELVLRPNDDTNDELPSWDGAATSAQAWDRAVRTAVRASYVVQKQVPDHPVSFPVDLYGDIVYRDLNVDVHPHAFLGKVQGCSARISAAGGFSTLTGMAPAFILETKS